MHNTSYLELPPVDGCSISASFRNEANKEVGGRVKQILLSAYIAYTSGDSLQRHPCNMPSKEG